MRRRCSCSLCLPLPCLWLSGSLHGGGNAFDLQSPCPLWSWSPSGSICQQLALPTMSVTCALRQAFNISRWRETERDTGCFCGEAKNAIWKRLKMLSTLFFFGFFSAIGKEECKGSYVLPVTGHCYPHYHNQLGVQAEPKHLLSKQLWGSSYTLQIPVFPSKE